ncbi:hypothetical protein [Novipirellula sp.]|uniref:hypothetical protein n=1 Tax=Novipirellula sp. TaxID=2795430 RepID=UPI003564C442
MPAKARRGEQPVYCIDKVVAEARLGQAKVARASHQSKSARQNQLGMSFRRHHRDRDIVGVISVKKWRQYARRYSGYT